jgi:hypothetical protein
MPTGRTQYHQIRPGCQETLDDILTCGYEAQNQFDFLQTTQHPTGNFSQISYIARQNGMCDLNTDGKYDEKFKG